MGIARALERVKRQAKQGGLQGVISGLGRELRSEQIPVPLRAAAQRIAALLPFEHVAVEHAGSGGRAGVVTHADDLVIAAPPRNVANDAVVHMSASVDAPGPREGASTTGSDAGVEPGPVEPEAGTPVDPETVGATPEINASPIEVEPVDATPVDVRSTDATPVEVVPVAANPIVPQLVPDDVSVGTSAARDGEGEEPEAAATVAGEKTEEELALGGEEAKNLARSGSRSKKRSRSKGTTSKKK